jgi:hypothetical protein
VEAVEHAPSDSHALCSVQHVLLLHCSHALVLPRSEHAPPPPESCLPRFSGTDVSVLLAGCVVSAAFASGWGVAVEEWQAAKFGPAVARAAKRTTVPPVSRRERFISI